jgi:hypothetical protein
VTILIPSFRDIKYRQHGRHNDEESCFHKVTTRTYPLTNAKKQRRRWVISEAPIFVEKTLGVESFWVWVNLWVVKDCPDILLDEHQKHDGKMWYHALATIREPLSKNVKLQVAKIVD